jgi:hypothetical protein
MLLTVCCLYDSLETRIMAAIVFANPKGVGSYLLPFSLLSAFPCQTLGGSPFQRSPPKTPAQLTLPDRH